MRRATFATRGALARAGRDPDPGTTVPQPPDAPSERKAPVRRAPDAPSERKAPIRRAPDAPSERKPPASATLASPFPPRATASAKQLALFELARGRAEVLAAVKGMSASAADTPFGPGKWSTRETLLHLVVRDRVRLDHVDEALRGVPAWWKDFDLEAMARQNAQDLAPLLSLDWAATQRLLHETRRELTERFECVSEEPAERWSEAQPFGWLVRTLPPHDRHHAAIIQRWRTGAGAVS